jgi:uncharacterized Zn finger protein
VTPGGGTPGGGTPGGRTPGGGEAWWHEVAAGPRRVDGGIRARSKRGAIGETWWSRRFIDVLESYGMSGRLSRGRSYARAGQVLDFELTQGRVTARVQGSRAAPYKVRIGVLPLTTPQWRRVTDALGAQALFRAKLLAGEMPAEIEDVFADCGTPLFPRSARDLEMSCSCPDWGVPCKHLAAVCYVLAEAFDDDPFGLLAWRGRGREELLGSLRRLPPAAVAEAPPVIDVSAPPLAECLRDRGPEGFWSPGMSRARLRAVQAVPVTTPDLVLRTVAPPPVRVRGMDLGTLLAPGYGRFAEADSAGDDARA